VTDAIAQLRRGLSHTGEAPFGSGFQQAAANVIDAFGVDAELAIGSACGTSWDGHRLRGGGRWMDGLEESCGLRVRRLHADSWPAAEEAEREILAAGLPLIAGIDSFGIPSPHQGPTHLVHAVIVLEAGAGEVTVCDPMNEPAPTYMDRLRYARFRAADCVDRFEMIVCDGEPTDRLRPATAVEGLVLDLARHTESDRAALVGFIEWVEESGATDLDVAEVGAERLYAARMLRTAAAVDGRLGPHAKAFGSLSRRWYLLHMLLLESAEGRRVAPDRLAGLLRSLAAREDECREDLLSMLGAEVLGRLSAQLV
jgi:hypothetical protein